MPDAAARPAPSRLSRRDAAGAAGGDTAASPHQRRAILEEPKQLEPPGEGNGDAALPLHVTRDPPFAVSADLHQELHDDHCAPRRGAPTSGVPPKMAVRVVDGGGSGCLVGFRRLEHPDELGAGPHT